MAKVLLIDDSVIVLELMQKALSAEGIETVASSNARGVVELVREHAPDLLLLDIEMPECDGIATCAALKEHNRDLIVVFFSSLPRNEIEKVVFKSGADGLIEKTSDMVAMAAQVKDLIG